MAMTNVSFLRGLHANLPSSGNAIEGAFYLTTDSNRLYVGNENKNLVDLNKYINIVNAVTDIDKTKAQVGDFYYVKSDNLLVVCELNASNEKEFTLINQNTNTKNKSASGDFSISASNDVATVKYSYTVTDTDNKTVTDESQFTITGGDNIVVTANGSNIEIDGAVYTLGLTTNPNAQGEVDSVTLALTNSLGGDPSECTFKSGENVTLTKDASGNIVISSSYVNTKVASAESILNADGSVSVKIVNNDNSSITSTASAPITFKVGDTSYIPGETLDVYTKAEIDSQLKGLNGMTYKGTVDEDHPLPTSNVSSGDTYLVADGEVEYNGADKAKKGDLLIATGTEGSNGYLTSITWTYVPSGDDAEMDTQYKFTADATNNKIKLTTKDGLTTVGSHTIKVENGGALSISSSSANNGADMTTTLSHNKINAFTPATESLDKAKTVSAVSGIEFDEYGHITGYKVTTSTLLSYTLSGTTAVDADANVATYTTKLVDSQGATVSTVDHKFTSTSLDLDVKSNVVSVDLNWGSF